MDKCIEFSINACLIISVFLFVFCLSKDIMCWYDPKSCTENKQKHTPACHNILVGKNINTLCY